MFVILVGVAPDAATADLLDAPKEPIPFRAVAKSATSVHEVPSHCSVNAEALGVAPP